MNDLAYWTRKLQEAEQELEAATRRTDVNAAAQRLMRVKAELKRCKGAASALPPLGCDLWLKVHHP